LANKMDGTLHQAHESLGLIALRQGDHNEAVRRFTQALALAGPDSINHHNRGAAHLIAGRDQEANMDFAKACKSGEIEACAETVVVFRSPNR
jgi:Flp pilus assembly protein TadD